MRRRKRAPWLAVVLVIALVVVLVGAAVWLGRGTAETGQDSHSSSGTAPEQPAPAESSVLAPEPVEEEETVSIPQYDFIVCLDPGHGGNDVGCVSADGREEAADNLALALLTRAKLQLYGVTVLMTREGDTYIDKKERCVVANDGGADFFVSLHRNLLDTDTSACGVEIWNEVKHTKEEDALAENLMAALELAGIQRNRGIKHGNETSSTQNYYVNSVTKMPAALIELGFLSNEQDNLLFDEKLEAYAQAIADGVIATWEQLGGGSTGEKTYLASEVESLLAAAKTKKDEQEKYIPGDWPQEGRTNDGVNLRVGPGTEYDKVTSIGVREKVTVTGAVTNDLGETWYEVTCVGTGGTEYEGYCRSDFIDFTS